MASGSAFAEDEQSKKTFTTRSIIQHLKPKEDEPSLGGFRGVKIIQPQTQKQGGVGNEPKAVNAQQPQVQPVTVNKPKKAPPSINMSVQFEFGSAVLTREAKMVLKNLGEALASEELIEFRFLLAGHTDAVGSSSYNKKLSEKRAASVRNYLIDQHGIGVARLNSVGKGEDELLDAKNPESGENRRVQITNLGTANR